MPISGTGTNSNKNFMEKKFVRSAEASNSGEQFTTYMQSNGFESVADEALAVGGSNLGKQCANVQMGKCANEGIRDDGTCCFLM